MIRRSRSTGPRPARGKPAGATNVRLWYWGLKAPKKKSRSFTSGPPSVAPKSPTLEAVVFTVPLTVVSWRQSAARLCGLR